MCEPLPYGDQGKFLQRLSRRGRDRSPPIEFAGRSDDLRWLQDKLDMARDGEVGISTIVEGIPGIGKTALVKNFCATAEDSGVMSLTFEPEHFGNPLEIASRMAFRILESGTWKERRAVRKATKISSGTTISGGAYGVAGQIGTTRSQSSLQTLPQPETGSLARALSVYGVGRNIPFILFVDEAHRLKEDADGTVGELQMGLDGFKVLPVYAGVRHQVGAKIEELCSTRLADDSKRTLWHLSDRDRDKHLANVPESRDRIGTIEAARPRPRLGLRRIRAPHPVRHRRSG